MMNSFATWTGSRNKPLTKIHVRPKRNLYSKLRHQQPEKCSLNAKSTGYENSEVAASTLNLSSDDDSEEEIVTYELSKVKNLRRGESSRATGDDQQYSRCALENSFVEKEVEAGDTLHNLALRYGCKVSEMKRINKLINDQEFYGLSRIKVPVKEHGFAKEQLEKENELKKKNLARREDAFLNTDCNGPCTSSDGTRLISIRDNRNAKEFLQQMDADLERIRKSTKTEKDTLEEVTMSLTCKRFHPFSEPKQPRNFPPLKILIFVIVLALIAFPIVIIFLMIYSRSTEAFHSNLTHFQMH